MLEEQKANKGKEGPISIEGLLLKSSYGFSARDSTVNVLYVQLRISKTAVMHNNYTT